MRKRGASSPGLPPRYVQANSCAIIAVARIGQFAVDVKRHLRTHLETCRRFYALRPWSILSLDNHIIL
jgi:hypothetical protein